MATGIAAIEEKYKDLTDKLFLFENPKSIGLNLVVIKKELMGQGIGSRFMNDLCAYADSVGKLIVLSPSSSFGGSVSRLKAFYKRFGFIENKGRNKDFAISDAMYRLPRALKEERNQHINESISIYPWSTSMKVKELKQVIRESVKKVITENQATKSFRKSATVNGISISVGWDAGYGDYSIYFPQIDMDAAKNYGVGDQVIRISENPQDAARIFEKAVELAGKKEISGRATNVYRLFKEIERVVTHMPRAIQESITALNPMSSKLKRELPALMSKYEWQIPLDALAKKLGVPDSEKEVLLHMVTDPDNTGGVEYEFNPTTGYITAINSDDNMNTILGHDPVHQSMDPRSMDQTELGNPLGTSAHPDHEEEFGYHDPDKIGPRITKNEDMGMDIGSGGGLEDKIEQAVTIAAHCAKTLSGAVPHAPNNKGSLLSKCFDDIMDLFADSPEEIAPKDLEREMLSALEMQVNDSGGSVWRTTKAIIHKVIEKLNVHAPVSTFDETLKEQVKVRRAKKKGK